MSYRISYQPIPQLAPSDSAWAWSVSDGTFIVGRFNSREHAEVFRDALRPSTPISVYECEHGHFGGCSKDAVIGTDDPHR